MLMFETYKTNIKIL